VLVFRVESSLLYFNTENVFASVLERVHADAIMFAW